MELSQTVAARGLEFSLAGTYEAGFGPVVDAFVENFRIEDEVGAACSIVLNGRTVVDIWGGWRNADRSRAWGRGWR